MAMNKLVAISYARVSTSKQSEESASGLERQERAIARWLEAHPHYELDREVRAVGSGAKAGRFEWFIQELREGRLPQGTCLVVEKISRFSREPVTEVLETLIRLFRAGGCVAACELGGEVLSNFDGQNGAVFILVGAIQRARGEWEERRDRALGSSVKKRRLIAEGQKPFQPRQKGKRADYPFWLDFDPSAGKFVFNSQAEWLRQAFLWAPEVGSTVIARRLKETGVRSPSDRRKSLSDKRITRLLKDRAVLGERQAVDAQGRPVGDPVRGVYPPLVTEDEWRLARAAIEARFGGNRRTGTKHHLLFEGQVFCAHCGGAVGVSRSRAKLAGGGTKTYGYLRCRERDKDRSRCSAPPQHPYDEERMLQRLHAFRWAEFFSDEKHEEEVAAARKRVLSAQADRSDVERQLVNLRAAALEQARSGGTVGAWLEDEAKRLEAAFSDAQATENAAKSALGGLERRRTGKEAQRAIQKRVEAFLVSDRASVDQREAFIQWLSAEGLVIEFNLETGAMEFGVGEVAPGGHLVGLDQRMEDAAGFGIPIEEFRAFIEERDSAVGN